MNRARFGKLEVLSSTPVGRLKPVPLLFIHGAFTGAWCLQEHFLPFFAEAGYAAYAVSLSGHGNSRGKEYLDHLSIADYVADVVEAMSSHRPYRPARGMEVGLEEISTKRGTVYDSAVVDACLKLFREKGFKLAV